MNENINEYISVHTDYTYSEYQEYINASFSKRLTLSLAFPTGCELVGIPLLFLAYLFYFASDRFVSDRYVDWVQGLWSGFSHDYKLTV